jgi:hypothetical protein
MRAINNDEKAKYSTVLNRIRWFNMPWLIEKFETRFKDQEYITRPEYMSEMRKYIEYLDCGYHMGMVWDWIIDDENEQDNLN